MCSTRVVSLDLEAIEELPPELTGALTFHLPLELAALELAGADPAVIAARTRRRLAEAYAEGLVDPPLYRWAVDHYRSAAEGLLHDDPQVRRAAFGAVRPLGDGLAGAAFHGLIRLGYGLWRRRAPEVARGLAYLRCRRQVLVAGDDRGQGDAVGDQPGGPAPLPGADELDGLTVFDLMNIAAGCEDRAALRPWGQQPLTVHRLAAAALSLAARNPSSFVAVHTVTGLHGLSELHRCVDGLDDVHAPVSNGPLACWWDAYATALGTAHAVLASFPREGLPAGTARLDSSERMLAAAVASGETHDVKLVLALQRLASLGVVSVEDAMRVGMVKLAATECRAH